MSYLIFFIFRIHQERLKELAEQISQCIPGEIKVFFFSNCIDKSYCCMLDYFLYFFQETYYVPYKKLLNKKSNAKGKLYDKYVNFLRSLRNNGLAPLSRNTIETQTTQSIFLLIF